MSRSAFRFPSLRASAFVLSVGFVQMACARSNVYVPGESYSPEEVDAVNDERDAQLRVRATHDLSCEEIDVTCLETQIDGFCISAGVDGCQQRATYVLVETAQFRMQWVLDAAVRTTPPEQRTAATEAEADTWPE